MGGFENGFSISPLAGGGGGGSVTAVTATSPLVSSGGTAPDISITAGTTPGDVLKWDGSAWAPNGFTAYDQMIYVADGADAALANGSPVYPMDNGVLLSEIGTSALPNAAGWQDAQMEMVAGTMKFGMWDGAAISSITSMIATPLNNWYNFTIVYDGTTLRAYVNGVAAGTNTFARMNPTEGGAGIHYAIAATDITNMGDGSYANMRLGQFLVYSTALSADQVLQNFNATRSTYSV